jgi:hypothetical protein
MDGGDVVVKGRIRGEFTGWTGETVFELDNGQKWQQARYAYWYHYQYRPEVVVYRDGSKHFLKLVDDEHSVEVRKVS